MSENKFNRIIFRIVYAKENDMGIRIFTVDLDETEDIFGALIKMMRNDDDVKHSEKVIIKEIEISQWPEKKK